MNSAPIHFGRMLLAGVISVALMSLATAQVNSNNPSPASSDQPQLAPLHPEFLYYQELLRLGLPTAPTSIGGRGLGLLPSPLSLPHLVITASQTPAQAFPASYDLRTYSKVTAVRNQGNCGACWTFATFGSMESVLLTASTRDFSENNLKNLHGFNWTPCAGGNSAMSMAYLARWSGPVEEVSDPYQATDTNTSPAGLTPQKHVQDVILIPARGGSLANDALKTALTTYGAVYTVMTWDDNAYNTSTASYYYTGSVSTNHGVTLVGWDDNYSRYNFATTPAGNGAFLIKNSWGTSWGQSGYFWISYYDTKYASLVSMVPSNNESTANFTRQYSYDPLGWVASFGYNNPSAWYANVFTAAASEQLKAISTYAASDNSTYTVYIYTGVTGNPTTGTLAATKSGTFTNAGYHTVPLTTPVALTAGAKFSVVIQITTPGYNYPIPIEYSVSGFSTAATASTGQSYYGNTGTTWTDITSWNSTANVCIKAFTGTVAPDLSITKTHSGNFVRGQTGATYTITVSNVGAASTSGTVTVTDSLPTGLTVTGMSGTNWSCSTSSYICTRSDSLAAGSSYPVITLTTTVSATAPSSVTNTVSVSATGDPNSANNTASDPTSVVNPTLLPDLAITKTHTGSFTLGQTGATYTITVQNVGAGPTSGTVTVTDSIPTGLTATAISGASWTCTQPSGPCTRSDALAAGGSYPPITLTVTVSTSAGTSVTNIAGVSGGGDSNGANNQASDLTSITTQLQFISVTPCRIMDTRTNSGFSGAFGPPSLVASNTRSIPIPSSGCGIPSTAKAYSLNVTAIPRSGSLAYLTIWPTGISQPLVSTLNSWDGSILANAAIVPAGTGGAISVYVTNNADLVIDINGYFAPPTTGSLMFYPVTPCRVLDTRNANGTFGGPNLTAGVARSFPIRSSACGIPATAQSYSLNVTAVPIGPLGYLTAWPTGLSQPLVSTLNAMDGTVLANAAIVPAGTNGAVSFYASNSTHLVVDINGYFAPPGTGGLNFYALTPCRVLDTRNPIGPYGGPIVNGTETRPIQVRTCSCGLPASALAYSLNMTVVPPGFMSFLAVWPAGLSWSGVSTLNDYKGLAVANAALVPAGTSGAVNIYTSNPSHVIMDINGYFGQ